MDVLLAYVNGHGGRGPGLGPWILFFPLVWAAVLAGLFLVLRRTVWRHRSFPHGAGGDAPLAVLGRRYASGEIDEEEYQRRRTVLGERRNERRNERRGTPEDAPGGPDGGSV